MILHDRARRYRIALGRCCFGPHLSLFAAALPPSQHLHTRFLPCFGDQPYLASSASRRPTAHPIFSLPTLSSRMTSRKAKFKDGAAVVIGVAEGTMSVDVEDDEDDEDNEKVEEDNYGKHSSLLSDMTPVKCRTSFRARRARGEFVSTPAGRI